MNISGLFLVIHFMNCHALPDIIRIGGLFHSTDSKQEIAFRYAVEKINGNRDILPKSRLSAQIEQISPQDSFHASKRVCHLLKTGIAAIFGPQSAHTASHVQSICDTMEIPHLETRWDFRLKREGCLVNLYPHPTTLSKAYVDLVKAMGWKSFTIIYENNEGLVRLQELLKAHGPTEHPITIKQLGEDSKVKHGYRPLLKQIKNSAESHIVLDCSIDKIYTVLKQAQEIGMMTDYHSYFITSLDLHAVDLSEFKHGGTNITAFRIVNPEKTQNVVQDWIFGEQRYLRKLNIEQNEDNYTFIKTETALMYDAVHLFARALHVLDASQQIDIKPLSCDSTNTWDHGYSLINYMKNVEMTGLTGSIKFDNQGFRSDFILDIIELNTKDGLKKIGRWNSTRGINFTRSYGEIYTQIVDNLHNKTFIVTTILSAPYCMYKESSKTLTGNSQFEGYSIDLIQEISRILGFNYTIQIVPDGRYGSFNRKTKEWDGMIKELLDQKADLAIADLTITYDREQAVDFTMPFMNLGISILYRKPVKQPPNLFSFLSPLSLDVWIYMATAYLGVSVLLFILARFSPYEWENSRTSTNQMPTLENDYTLLNSLWFTIGSLMQQGSDIAPRAISTRMVAGMWWFFTLIMISSYTANLAAFLTVERMDSPIESAEDLAKQTKIKYGALKGGSTAAFFRDSNFSTYQRMWHFMENANPSNEVFTNSNVEGVDRVVKGKGSYAFLMESTSIEYAIERNCELTQIGGLLDSKGYGIAMPPNSPYRTAISGAILKLQEEGKLHILKTKWWKEKHGGGSCRDETSKSSSTASELGLANVGGVFVVLMGGMGVACVVAVCEFLWKSRKIAVEERISVVIPSYMIFESVSELTFKMKIGLLKNFLHCFKLRQGTILIAILQLVLSGFITIFIILGLTHESGIQDMIARDTEDVLEREALEEITSKHINSHRMELAHHNATEKVYIIYCGLVIVIVHFISTLLLLYGALMNNRYLMTPWMMVMMTIIVALFISLFLVQQDCPFIAVIGGKANVTDRLIVLTLALICFYMWLVVYSTYRYLEIKKGVVHEVHTVNDQKYKHPVVMDQSRRQQRQHISLFQPYNV